MYQYWHDSQGVASSHADASYAYGRWHPIHTASHLPGTVSGCPFLGRSLTWQTCWGRVAFGNLFTVRCRPLWDRDLTR